MHTNANTKRKKCYRTQFFIIYSSIVCVQSNSREFVYGLDKVKLKKSPKPTAEQDPFRMTKHSYIHFNSWSLQ